MARSRTPPPISDRKRLLVGAHRRRSTGTSRSSGSPADSDEVEAGLLYDGDAMEVDETPSAGAARERRNRRSRGFAEAAGRLEPPHTPERTASDSALPTWTPLAVPSTSSNASETSDPPPSASASDSTLRHPVPSSSRQEPPRRPLRTYTSNARRAAQLSTHRPSQGLHVTTKTPRQLSAEVKPADLLASSRKTTTRRTDDAQSQAGTSSVTLQRKRKRDESSERLGSPHHVPDDTHIHTPRVSGRSRDKGKGKARDVSSDSLIIRSNQEIGASHSRELSPEVPPPPEFEQFMHVYADDVDRISTFSSGRPRSAWLDTPRALEPGIRYYVGKRPPPQPPSSQPDKGKGRAYTPQSRKKRHRDRTQDHDETPDGPDPIHDHTDQWVAALNAASTMNAQLMGLSPPRSSYGSAGAHSLVAAVNAAGRHNTRLHRLATANRGKNAGQKRDEEHAKQPRKEKDGRPRAVRRRTIAGPSASHAAEPEKPGDDGGWYLDLDTFSWRRRSASAHGGVDAGPSARAAGAPRSAAGPSSAAARGSHPTGPASPGPSPANRPRGRPRKSAPAPAAGEDRPTRPPGRPRKHPRPAPDEEPPKSGPGRPRKERVPTVFEPARADAASPPPPPSPPHPRRATLSLLDLQEPITPTLLARTHAVPPRPAAEESEGSSPTLVPPPVLAVPQEMEGGGGDGSGQAVGGSMLEPVGEDKGKGRAREPLGDADLAPSPFVAPGPSVAVAKPKAPFEVLTWRVPQEPRSFVQSAPAAVPTPASRTSSTVSPAVVPEAPASSASADPSPLTATNNVEQAVLKQQPPSRAQNQTSSQLPSQPSSQHPVASARLQTHQELYAQNPGEFSQVTVVPRGPLNPRYPSTPFQQAVSNAVKQLDAVSRRSQSGQQAGRSTIALGEPQPVVEAAQPANQQPVPPQMPSEAHTPPPTNVDTGEETEDDEHAVAPAAAGDLTDDSAVPEYQSLADLARALAAYVDAHPRGQPPGPFFVGCCALLVDEKTRIAEPYARGVAGELRDALRRQGGWAFRSQADAMRASFVRGKRSVELTYGCACPYLPAAQGKWCGGAVHVGVREVQDLAAVYVGVKGVRISVRVEH